jgi:hypothetical protein
VFFQSKQIGIAVAPYQNQYAERRKKNELREEEIACGLDLDDFRGLLS